jgi:hypothetical protein
MEWYGLDSSGSGWRALVNTVMNLRVLRSCTTGGFSRRAKLHGVSSLKTATNTHLIHVLVLRRNAYSIALRISDIIST